MTDPNLDIPLSILKDQTARSIAECLDKFPKEWRWKDNSYDSIVLAGELIRISLFTTIWIYGPGHTTLHYSWLDRRRIKKAVKRWKKAYGNDLRALLETRQHRVLIDELAGFRRHQLKSVA